MKNGMKKIAIVAGCCAIGTMAGATPSTENWTPFVTDIQGFDVYHLGIDNYFTVGKKADDGGGQFPTDVGLTVGVLPFEKILAEVGVDMLESSDNPWYFNAKVGTPEGAIFDGSPAFSIGIFNVGTKKNATDYNIWHAEIGKTLPKTALGTTRIFAGLYTGNPDTLVDENGNKENQGWGIAIDHGFWSVKDPGAKDGEEYNRIVLSADYASGDNAIGGGAVGVYYYFTKYISVLTGPVWFNSTEINGEWKWTTQLDINF